MFPDKISLIFSEKRFPSEQMSNLVSIMQDCISLLSSKAWQLEKAYGFNFFPGTERYCFLSLFHFPFCDNSLFSHSYTSVALNPVVDVEIFVQSFLSQSN